MEMKNEDPWDSVVNFEQGCFENGRVEGLLDATMEQSSMNDAYIAGVLKGYLFGLEAGYYASVSESSLKDTESENTSTTFSGRIKNRILALHDKAKNIPTANTPDVDFDAYLMELRMMYRAASSSSTTPLPGSGIIAGPFKSQEISIEKDVEDW